jgi:hypothetical protein
MPPRAASPVETNAKGVNMKIFYAITVTTALLLSGPTTGLAQSVPLEAKGFPITLHQAQVMGLDDVQEQPSDLIATYGGMPVSPLQALVLEPRARMTQEQVAEKLTGAGYANVNFEAPSDYSVSATINGAPVKFRINSATGTMR